MALMRSWGYYSKSLIWSVLFAIKPKSMAWYSHFSVCLNHFNCDVVHHSCVNINVMSTQCVRVLHLPGFLAMPKKLYQVGGGNTGDDLSHIYKHNFSHNPHSCMAFPQCVCAGVYSENFSGKNFCHSLDSSMASHLNAHAGAVLSRFFEQNVSHRLCNCKVFLLSVFLYELLNYSSN